MRIEIGVWFFVIHLVLAIIYSVLILIGRSNLRREFIFVILLIPFLGVLTGLVVELLVLSGEEGTRPIDMEPAQLEDDILWKSLKKVDEEGNLIPLEEALLINDYKTRRELILDTLYDDPMKYLDILLVARHNDDVETSHYATTVISNAQRNFQLNIQKLSYEVGQHPNNLELIDKYIDTLNSYIESGLLEEYLLKNQRIRLSSVLDHKLALVPQDKETLILKLRNHLALNEKFEAAEAVEQLKKYWPKDEQTWIEAIRVCVESHDREKLKEIVDEIEDREINWSFAGKQQVDQWVVG